MIVYAVGEVPFTIPLVIHQHKTLFCPPLHASKKTPEAIKTNFNDCKKANFKLFESKDAAQEFLHQQAIDFVRKGVLGNKEYIIYEVNVKPNLQFNANNKLEPIAINGDSIENYKQAFLDHYINNYTPDFCEKTSYCRIL